MECSDGGLSQTLSLVGLIQSSGSDYTLVFVLSRIDWMRSEELELKQRTQTSLPRTLAWRDNVRQCVSQ